MQWLLDHEGMYTALETVIAAERLGLTPVSTPAYSPESNGMAGVPRTGEHYRAPSP